MAQRARSRHTRNLTSALNTTAKVTGDIASKTAVSAIKWFTSGHKAYTSDPSTAVKFGFSGQNLVHSQSDSDQYFSGIVAAGLMFILIAFGIPLPLVGSGHVSWLS